MKVCAKCGNVSPDEAAFCISCGNVFQQNQGNSQQANYQGGFQQANYQRNPQQANYRGNFQQAAGFNAQVPPGYMQYMGVPMSEKAFYKQYMSKSLKSWNVILIVCCVLSALANLGQFSQLELQYGIDWLWTYANSTITLLISATMFYTAAAIVFGVKKKWYIAMAIMAVTVMVCIASMVTTGMPSGWLIIFGGIYSMIHLYRLDKAYKLYKSNNIAPLGPI